MVQPALTKVFGEALVEIAKENEKVVGVTAAMPDGTGLNILRRKYSPIDFLMLALPSNMP